MVCCKKSFGFLVLLTAIGVGYVYHRSSQEVPPPLELRKDGFWGRTKTPVKDNTAIKPFTINISDAVLIDLKERLSKVRLTESLEGTNFNYGFRSEQLRKVIDYWTTKYDWRKQEKELNALPQFKTQIEGIDIHFIHIKSPVGAKNKTPLMLVHGWPGSVVEFLDIIPHLKGDFELVIPSLPGYGFSEAAHKPGLDGYHISRIFVKLMERLGHQKFLYQGGDWGAIIGKAMAVIYPEKLHGYHSNMAVVPMTGSFILKALVSELGYPGLVFDDAKVDGNKLNPFLEKVVYQSLEESGYAHIQSTKPDTVGVALNNDPAGLAAYILEKFSTWTNEGYRDRTDGGLTDKFTMDRLLTNVMMYWVTGSITTSQRLYKEFLTKALQNPYVVHVPTGILMSRHELLRIPRSLVKPFYPNLTQYTDLDRGGHFLAMEEPKLVAEDIKLFVKKLNLS